VSSTPDGPPRPEKLKPPSALACPAIQRPAARTVPSALERPDARSARTANAVVLTRPANEPFGRRLEASSATRLRDPIRAGCPALANSRIVRSRAPRSPGLPWARV
jgi:hypothetical protein